MCSEGEKKKKMSKCALFQDMERKCGKERTGRKGRRNRVEKKRRYAERKKGRQYDESKGVIHSYRSNILSQKKG